MPLDGSTVSKQAVEDVGTVTLRVEELESELQKESWRKIAISESDWNNGENTEDKMCWLQQTHPHQYEVASPLLQNL